VTGPEHYAKAEELLANADRHITEEPSDMRIAEVSAAAAQVHATLALAASQLRSLPAAQAANA
jgi:hypothetical protein